MTLHPKHAGFSALTEAIGQQRDRNELEWKAADTIMRLRQCLIESNETLRVAAEEYAKLQPQIVNAPLTDDEKYASHERIEEWRELAVRRLQGPTLFDDGRKINAVAADPAAHFPGLRTQDEARHRNGAADPAALGGVVLFVVLAAGGILFLLLLLLPVFVFLIWNSLAHLRRHARQSVLLLESLDQCMTWACKVRSQELRAKRKPAIDSSAVTRS